MAHETLFSHDYNGFIRSLRAFLKDAPRVVRANDHDDIANLGVAYMLGGGGSRPAGDILHIAPEDTALRSVYRLVCAVGTAAGGSYQPNIADTVTFNTGARTITSDAGNDWAAAGVVVGDLIRIDDAVTAGNNGLFRVLSITNGGATNDVITLNTLDTLAASDAADAINLRPITGGSIFEIREDFPGANNFIGWAMSSIECVSNDSRLWVYMRDGSSWAATDYAEFELERGAFSMHDSRSVLRVVSLNDNGGGADTITRLDYNGNFIRDGFVATDGGAVRVTGSGSGNDGTYPIVSLDGGTLTLTTGDLTATELDAEVTLLPTFSVQVDFAAAGRTITRSTGSWLDSGFQDGGQVEIADAVDGINNDMFDILTVTDTVITLVVGTTIADETGDTVTITPRNSVLQKWGEHRYRWSSSSGVTGTSAQSLDSGELPPVPDSDGNYTSEWVGIGPGDDVNNNPETIYCGWQSQFSGPNIQNVEQRVFDAVSDASFGGMGNASSPTYIYLTLNPSMDTFMSGDGSMVAGLIDVNTSVTEWFYSGFGDMHGTQAQHPRPMLQGGINWQSGGSRVGTGARYQFFPFGTDYTGTNDVNDAKVNSSAWHRWVDGQYLSAAIQHQSNGTQVFSPNQNNTELWNTMYPPASAGWSLDILNGGLDNFNPSNGDSTSNPSRNYTFTQALRSTPTTITPNPNREFPLIPCSLAMTKPQLAVVIDYRRIFHIPGAGQATKNRIIQGGKTYIVGQNHEKTGQQDFAALLLD